MLRRITFGMLLLATVAVLVVAVYLFWNTRPWDYLLAIHPDSNLDARSEVLSDRITVYNGQVEDLGRMVAILMVVSALYVIAFAVSTHLYAERCQRLCRQALDSAREDLAQAAGDLREIREGAARAVERAALDSGRVEELLRSAQQAIAAAQPVPRHAPAVAEQAQAAPEAVPAAPEPEAAAEEPPPPSSPEPDPVESARAKYHSAVIAAHSGNPDEAERLHTEALELSAGDPGLHAEIEYELGCVLARRGPEAFDRAMEHLTRAFATLTPLLDRRISRDIDEGGALYQLASHPPYDRRINDLLLNVSVT